MRLTNLPLNLIIALYPDELSLKLLGFQASH